MAQTITPKNKKTAKGSFLSMNGNNLHIIDLDTGESLGLQGMPTVINIDPNSKFSAVGSPQRNNPLYIFSGSEDVIEFELSWFTNDPKRIDVIGRCKWLEIATKADGYKGRPHYFRFMWGKLFSDSIFHIVSAKYTLSNFDKNFDYLPTTARQTIGLRRVTLTNATHNQIASLSW